MEPNMRTDDIRTDKEFRAKAREIINAAPLSKRTVIFEDSKMSPWAAFFGEIGLHLGSAAYRDLASKMKAAGVDLDSRKIKPGAFN